VPRAVLEAGEVNGASLTTAAGRPAQNQPGRVLSMGAVK
jgi:hypothetical protein